MVIPRDTDRVPFKHRENSLDGAARRAGVTDERNVLGTALEVCSEDPLTGYERDGCCHHLPGDTGRHEICAAMTRDFLVFSKERGNDLMTPRPDLSFPGLEPGDRWCVCVGRWIEAEREGAAPPVVLEATSEAVLDDIDRETLDTHEYEGSDD